MRHPCRAQLLLLGSIVASCGESTGRSQRALSAIVKGEGDRLSRLDFSYRGDELDVVTFSRGDRQNDRLQFAYTDGRISEVQWFHGEDSSPAGTTRYDYDGDLLAEVHHESAVTESFNEPLFAYDVEFEYDGDQVASRRWTHRSAVSERLCDATFLYSSTGALEAIDDPCEHRLDFMRDGSDRLITAVGTGEFDLDTYQIDYDESGAARTIMLVDGDRYDLTYQDGSLQRIDSGPFVTTFEYADHDIEGTYLPPVDLPSEIDDLFDLSGHSHPRLDPVTTIVIDPEWPRGRIVD